MGIITLTDRISVSVRAKNETESNSQKRATGRNIANALTSGGNDNISDSLADQLGNTSKPTIADEQGREWVAMSDIIAAGKKMKENGAFDEKTEYDGITANGIVYKLNPVYSGGYNGKQYWDVENTKVWVDRNLSSNALFVITGGHSVFFSKESFAVNMEQTAYNLSMYNDPPSGTPSTYHFTTNSRATTATINGVNYSFFINDDCEITYGHGGNNVYTIDASYKTEEHGYTSTSGDLLKCIAGTLFGPSHKSGGSLIDWTKPDDEIEEDIRNLHETWDVSDHAGSTTANGTYVLAGPIEFNPGD